jgi:hypothetical protein
MIAAGASLMQQDHLEDNGNWWSAAWPGWENYGVWNHYEDGGNWWYAA